MPAEKKSVVNGMVQCDTKLDGKTVVITGANSGIGYCTALDMLKRGARVIMACRSMSKMEEAKTKLLEEVKEGQVILKTLDLASLDSVRECAKDINENEERLDILINNAGVMLCPPGKTKDGFDMQFGVNHIGHFLFTNLLLDLIKKSAPSRIVIVSSVAHGFGSIMWDDINQNDSFNSLKAYGQSKSANILHCLELNKRLEGSGVTCYCLHPGGIKTNLQQHLGDLSHLPFWSRIFVKTWQPALRVVGLTPEQGAQTSIYCAVAPEVEKFSGKYFTKCSVTAPSAHCRSPADAERLWKVTEEMIENPGKTGDDKAKGDGKDGEEKKDAEKEEKNDETPAQKIEETQEEEAKENNTKEAEPEANGDKEDKE